VSFWLKHIVFRLGKSYCTRNNDIVCRNNAIAGKNNAIYGKNKVIAYRNNAIAANNYAIACGATPFPGKTMLLREKC
jgi:hypothetical protein